MAYFPRQRTASLLKQTFSETRNIKKSLSTNSRRFANTNRARSYAIPKCQVLLGASLPIFPVVHAFWGKSSEDKAKDEAREKEEQFIDEMDKLYSENEIAKLYQILKQYQDTSNAELLWRLGRAACDKGKMSSGEERKTLMYEAFACIQKALDLDETNFASHKWYAIMLDYIGEYEGTKERIAKAYHVKEHFLRAMELNPQDATTIYCLGFWCFTFADLPWYQKKIASVVFTTPPSSSYEEALGFFSKAEEMDPNFYSMNLLMLGKTYLRLGQTKEAQIYLTKARDFKVVTEDDKRAHQEATELLKGMGK